LLFAQAGLDLDPIPSCIAIGCNEVLKTFAWAGPEPQSQSPR
jgi:hypothetical protein